MKKLFFIFYGCLSLSAFGQKSNSEIVIGRKDSLSSRILKENRPYWIHFPADYFDTVSGFSPRRYPVLYLLDGDAHFYSVSGLVQILGTGINGTYVVPDMIVVAIPNTDRTRDLTPTHTDHDNTGIEQDYLKSSGGGTAFLNFIKDELIPHIDSSYRTMAYRVFVGHSFGGITVINALYTIPETFNAYIAIDPSLWWDQQTLLKKARTYFQHATLKGKTLYLAQANTLTTGDTVVNDHFESIKEFATLLETRNHSGLNWKYDYYGDDDHGSVPFISEYNGLRFIFNDYHIRYGDIFFHPELLLQHYSKFSEQTGVRFMPPEGVVNMLGYQAIYGKKYDLAIKYFQMNIDYYPNSSNVYDSMGDALMQKGELKKAIENFSKSVQLNPHNDHAKEMIRKLQYKLS
jgi:predicted alpha/beta superfamily hydrolase